MNTDTPETDAMVSADQHNLEDDNFFSASVYWRMCDLARTLERERDEAREKLATVIAQRDRLVEVIITHELKHFRSLARILTKIYGKPSNP